MQVTSAAALAEARAKSSVDPLGSLFEGMPSAGTSAEQVGPATDAPVTPQGSVRNELFDTHIILRENAYLKEEITGLNKKVNRMIEVLEKIDWKTIEVITQRERDQQKQKKTLHKHIKTQTKRWR